MVEFQVWQVKSCSNKELFPHHYSQIIYMSHYSDLLWSCNNVSTPKRTIHLPGFYENIRKNRNHSQTKTKIGTIENLWSQDVVSQVRKEIIWTQCISILPKCINTYMKCLWGTVKIAISTSYIMRVTAITIIHYIINLSSVSREMN